MLKAENHCSCQLFCLMEPSGCFLALRYHFVSWAAPMVDCLWISLALRYLWSLSVIPHIPVYVMVGNSIDFASLTTQTPLMLIRKPIKTQSLNNLVMLPKQVSIQQRGWRASQSPVRPHAFFQQFYKWQRVEALTRALVRRSSGCQILSLYLYLEVWVN